jgi:hypothetical protein
MNAGGFAKVPGLRGFPAHDSNDRGAKHPSSARAWSCTNRAFGAPHAFDDRRRTRQKSHAARIETIRPGAVHCVASIRKARTKLRFFVLLQFKAGTKSAAA